MYQLSLISKDIHTLVRDDWCRHEKTRPGVRRSGSSSEDLPVTERRTFSSTRRIVRHHVSPPAYADRTDHRCRERPGSSIWQGNAAPTCLLAPHGKVPATWHGNAGDRAAGALADGCHRRCRVLDDAVAQRKDPLCGGMRAGLSYPVRMRIKDRLPAPQRAGTSVAANIEWYKHLE
jgi:hypothetical protein